MSVPRGFWSPRGLCGLTTLSVVKRASFPGDSGANLELKLMLKIIVHDSKCAPCDRCTCGAEPVPTHPAAFCEYIELRDSSVIVHITSDYMATFDCANEASAKALAAATQHTNVSSDSWDTRGAT